MGKSTPEGKVKRRVKRLLDPFKPALYAHWPVQTGFGDATVDCNGAFLGHPFAIETKAPGKSVTTRQIFTLRDMHAAGYRCFVIDGTDRYPYRPLEIWLAKIAMDHLK